MLKIRLTRRGRKNQPFFRVVVIDKKRSAKGGRAVEILGFVDPLAKKKSFEKERILYWLKNGAQLSATVHNLLVSEKIISGPKINVSKSKKSTETVSATPAVITEAAVNLISESNPTPAPVPNSNLSTEPTEQKSEEQKPAETEK